MTTVIIGRSEAVTRHDTPKGRSYVWRDEVYPSVTTIIKGGIPAPALVNWAAQEVAEAAVALTVAGKLTELVSKSPEAAVDLLKRSPYAKRDSAANLGTEVHKWAESIILGAPKPVVPPEQRPFVSAFERFLADHRPEYLASEAPVFNRGEWYAGTLDAIVAIAGRRYVLDYKTGNGVYADAFVQLAAYRHADFLGLPDGTEHPMEPVDGCLVLHLRPTGYRLLQCAIDPEQAWDAFKAARRVWLWGQATRTASITDWGR